MNSNAVKAELLKILGVDPLRCTEAVIYLNVNDPVRVEASFEVFPVEIEDEALKTEMKHYTLVENED